MQITTRTIYDVLVVDMAGRLDSVAVGDASDRMVAIAEGDNKRVVLNLAGVDYVSSAGLRVLLIAARLLKTHRGELKLCAARSEITKVIEIAGFNSLLNHYASEQDAVTAFLGK
jgi:anti-sigma B factor antagonist